MRWVLRVLGLRDEETQTPKVYVAYPRSCGRQVESPIVTDSLSIAETSQGREAQEDRVEDGPGDGCLSAHEHCTGSQEWRP